jgi:DNA-binding transcriptional LysR family regulator
MRQLAAFEAVAAELHFGRAADRLGITQAAISQLIRRLEHEHEVLLFERSSHHVALTPAGAELLPVARRALRANDAFDKAAAAVAAGHRGTLRVATSEATAGVLADVLRAFGERAPDVRVELQALPSEAKVPGIRSGAIDLAFVRSPTQAAGVRVEALWTEPLVAVVPAASVQPQQRWADPAALSRLPLFVIGRAANAAMHDELVAQARVAGVEPTLGTPLIGGREGLAAIAAGGGWTLAPASHAPLDIGGITSLPFRTPTPQTTVSLLWRKTGASSMTDAFAQVAIETARAGAAHADPTRRTL